MNGTNNEWVHQNDNERKLERKVKELQIENDSLKRTIDKLADMVESYHYDISTIP